MGVHIGLKGTPFGIQTMNGDEIANSLNDDSEIVYDEKKISIYSIIKIKRLI